MWRSDFDSSDSSEEEVTVSKEDQNIFIFEEFYNV